MTESKPITEVPAEDSDPTYFANIPDRTKIIVTRQGDGGEFKSFAWASKSGRLCVPVSFYGCFGCAGEHDMEFAEECFLEHPRGPRQEFVIHVSTGYAITSFEHIDAAFELMDALDDLEGWNETDAAKLVVQPGMKERVVEIMTRVRKARADRGAK